MTEYYTPHWTEGDTLTIRAHTMPKGTGMSYPAMTVTAGEDGFIGGWDVWLSAGGDDAPSFYGFSVTHINGQEVQP